jgi:hypothetical protein
VTGAPPPVFGVGVVLAAPHVPSDRSAARGLAGDPRDRVPPWRWGGWQARSIACELFDYGGRQQELGEGQYFSYKHLGFAPRSLRVPAGLTVQFMLMEGRGGSLDADAARLSYEGRGRRPRCS